MPDRWALWKTWEDNRRRLSVVDYFQNLRIFEAMHREAKALGVFPMKDKLEGLENDLQLARKINARGPA